MSEAQLKSETYTAFATAVGGRNGHTENSDKVVDVDLARPKSTGVDGKTTPEDLFAAGYAACFGSACERIAQQTIKIQPSSIVVHSQVTVGEDVAGGFALKVKLKAVIEGVEISQAQKLVEAANKLCPYSKAIQGNVHVEVEAIDSDAVD